MLTAVAFALSLTALPKEVVLEPTDDVWVYQFAADQTTDQFLRVWSVGGEAVGEVSTDHMPFSYSCLKFDLSKLEGTSVKAATLVLTHDGAAGFSESDSKANPLEARLLTTDWNETSWEYAKVTKVHPSKDANTILGSGFAGPGSNGDTFTIKIDLMKGPAEFGKVYAEAMKSSKTVAFALTSKLSPEGQGEGFVYKMFSRSNDEAKRPKLVLELE